MSTTTPIPSVPAPGITELLKFADLQMAAEAFLVTGQGVPLSGQDLIDSLTLGNRHASRFTEIQANEFVDHWEVVAQQPNTATGFSGTLFRNKDTNELVMSFRSTEFIDDSARDNQATNALEIKETGFAWGQLRDMMNWYEGLKTDGKIPVGAQLEVTGYSLGGHLASAFNLMYPGDAARTVTFNGAGIGTFNIDETPLKGLVSLFAELSTQDYSSQIENGVLRELYGRLRTAVEEGRHPDLADQIALTGISSLVYGERASQQADMIAKAVGRIKLIRDEVDRLQTLTSGDPDHPGQKPQHVPASEVAQTSLDYQMAVLTLGQGTDAASMLGGAVRMVGGKTYDFFIRTQFDVVGDTNLSMVANSQWHIGTDVRVFIEDQPLYRGSVGLSALVASVVAADVKLLVDGYAQRDFGDTHSLVLIVDSLSVQNTLVQMLPEDQRTDAGLLGQLTSILRNASNLKMVNGDALFGDDQGKADGDALERMVNALADLALGPAAGGQPRLEGAPEGNTWHITQAVEGYSGRDALHALLQEIRGSDLYKDAAEGKVALQLTSSGSAHLGARTDFGNFAALYSLSPWVLQGVNEQASTALEALVGAKWGALYTDWKADKDALASGAAEDGLNFSSQWLESRADLLVRKNYFNAQNASYDNTKADAYGADKATRYDAEDIIWQDRQSELKIQRGQVTESTHYVIFGSEGNDADLTGERREDHLYGGGGADTLKGLGGNDHLEGGAGDDVIDGGVDNDTLVGGSGTDTYQFNGNWGVDTVIDNGGLGSLVVNGQALTGGEQVSANAWQSEDGQWRYASTERDELIITHATDPGRIIVRGWSQMQGVDAPLGLNLPVPQEVPPPETQPGMYALQGGYFVNHVLILDREVQIQPDGSIPGLAPIYDANDLMEGVNYNRDDPETYIHSTGTKLSPDGFYHWVPAETRAVSFWGLGGNDFMSGEQYDDFLDGGEGNDLIFGGVGSDVIHGGLGDDVIVSNVAARHNSDHYIGNLDPAYVAGPETTFTGTSGASNRWGVDKTEDGLHLRIDRAVAKTPGTQGDWYVLPERESDRDIVDAGDGNDYVWGGRGADFLMGGGGMDHINGQGGDDLILGGDDDDYIVGDAWDAMTLRLGSDYRDEGGVADYWLSLDYIPFEETLRDPALHGDDVIDAGAGNDEVWADGGEDLVFGGSGNDRLFGDTLLTELPIDYHGNDWMDGGEGDDLLIGFGGDDELLGSAGNDELSGDFAAEGLPGQFHGKDSLSGGDGNDLLIGDGNADRLTGGHGDDELQGDSRGLDGQFHGDDELDGGDGSDALFGSGGNDILYGGAGNDFIEADDVVGELPAEFHGNDHVDGGDGDDNIAGGGGDDFLVGGAGNDWIAGEDETETDSVSSLTGNDRIFGGAGNDTLVGGNGNDELDGGEGDDWLYGSAGNDRLDGGAGINLLKGGAGDDVYTTTASGNTVIEDNEGRNLVQGVGDLALAATLGGDLVFVSASRNVALMGAFHGGFAGDLLINGETISIEDFIYENLVDPLTLASAQQDVRFLSGQGDDEITANGANAQVRAGRGDDSIVFNAAGGTVLVSRGDGRDHITLGVSGTTAHPVDVQLGDGIDAADVWFTYDLLNNALLLHYSAEPDDVLELTYGGALPASVLDQPPVGEVRLSDGSVMALDFVPQVADEEAPFSYQLPQEIFASLGQEATLTASVGDDGGWPAWLQFDPSTRTFSGTPTNADVGSLSIRVAAVNGGDAESFAFVLAVRNVNDAPQAGTPLPAHTGREDEAWFYDLPEGSFVDVDAGDALTYTAHLSNGDPLPSWLAIDPESGRIQHSYGFAQATRLSVVVTATDTEGATAEQTFDLTVLSSIAPLAILGTPGDDVLTGGAWHDVLIGGYGNDILDGGAGNDLLIGGNANSLRGLGSSQGGDVYRFGRGDDHDEIWNGWSLEHATLEFKAGINPEDIHVSREGSFIIFTIMDTGETLTVPDFHRDSGTGYNVIQYVKFSDHPETVWEPDMVRRFALIGTHADDRIHGYDGADVLQGNSGNDTLWGGWGNDTYLYGGGDGVDIIWDAANGGNDRILMMEDVAPGDVMLFKVFPEITPNGALIARVVTGNTEIEIRNFFNGGVQEGIETIEFSDGTVWDRSYILSHTIGMAATADELIGTSQDDHFTVDHRGDRILEAAGGGIDSISSHISYTLPDNVENLTLTGPLTINGTGNSGDNVIIGNGADNILNWGGGGQDILQGGLGNDTYEIIAPSTTIAYWPGIYSYASINESPGGGIDVLRTNLFRASLAENVENLVVPSFYASQVSRDLSQKVVAQYTGNNGDNILDVSAVSSNLLPIELDGGAGNDVLIGSATGKADWAVYTSATAGVSVSLSLKGPQDTLSSGTEILVNIENLRGSSYSDVLGGDDQGNSLDGSLGADIMIGGLGNDAYYVDDLGDVIVESSEGGIDTVHVTGRSEYVLQDHLENINLIAPMTSSAIYVHGNDLNNTITGSNGGNADEVVIHGMGGNDVISSMGIASITELHGGDGDDHLTGSTAVDYFIGGNGNDYFVTSGWSSSHDVIRSEERVLDVDEINTLRLDNVRFDDLVFKKNSDDLIIRWAQSGQILVEDFFDSSGAVGDFNPLQVLWAGLTPSNMQSLSASQILDLVQFNQAPTVKGTPEAQEVLDGDWFSWNFSNAFSDDSGWQSLTYSATLEDGSPLPSWLKIDHENSRFTGWVSANGNETMRILITGTDEEGLSASTVLEISVLAEALVLDGTSSNDTLFGGGGDDVLRGFGGADQLQGAGGNDRLEGGLGNDNLFGQAGSDILIGGAGNDYLSGGAGNDIFEYSMGDGQDTLDAKDSLGAIDELRIHGWTPSQVQLLPSGNHLFLYMNSSQYVGLYNYFAASTVQNVVASDAKIDRIVFDNGQVWDQATLNGMLGGGMSAFSTADDGWY